MIVTNIKWEVDDITDGYLPTSIIISDSIDEDEIADTLSDEYGFLISEFSIMRLPMTGMSWVNPTNVPVDMSKSRTFNEKGLHDIDDVISITEYKSAPLLIFNGMKELACEHETAFDTGFIMIHDEFNTTTGESTRKTFIDLPYDCIPFDTIAIDHIKCAFITQPM